ncbi:PH domain-containing protein [Microlunatus sp. Y2014]|uniref:PH domain-containing protein n=1 Tax=Microlunatus sp. Y2014 TaxID=3418488 RepID=UPI003DA6EE6F
MSEQLPPAPEPTPTPAGTPAPTEPELSPPADLPRERRPHPLTPLIRGWIVLLAIVVYVGREFIPDGSNGNLLDQLPPLPYIIGGVAVVVALAALGSFVTWWFTKFVIDENELRIETGMLTKVSRKIGFNRIQSVDLIQPLGARLFSLAELRIEAGSGDGAKIRYLRRSDATRLRDYLLARAHGETADLGAQSDADVLADRASTDRVLTTISPGQLVGGFLLSPEFVWTVLIGVVMVVIGLVLDILVFFVPAFIGFGITVVSLLSRRVIAQFNYSLADTGRGLRITRGLTNLTSQSLPIDRIQGLRISQPLLWRPPGWYRVDVDVLGYSGGSDTGEGRSDASSLLLPVATLDQVRAALAHCLPGTDHEAVPLTGIPRRARWRRWWNASTIRYGVDERIAVNTIGWLVARREIVPHAKTQSVRITRGPVQRRFDLATVHIDTTKGPVTWRIPDLSGEDARALATSQLNRARHARVLAVADKQAREAALPLVDHEPEEQRQPHLSGGGPGEPPAAGTLSEWPDPPPR